MSRKQTCPACGIATDGRLFYPSAGKPFDREKCIAQICQHAKKSGCLNDQSNVETTQLLKALRDV